MSQVREPSYVTRCRELAAEDSARFASRHAFTVTRGGEVQAIVADLVRAYDRERAAVSS